MSRLDYVKDLKRLRQIASARKRPDIDRAPLECPLQADNAAAALEIDARAGYALQGREAENYLAATGAAASPDDIDDSGGCLGEHNFERIVIVSPRHRGGKLTRERSPLRPLVDQLYQQGARLLEDFAMHEALCGDLVAHRGQLPITALARFPRRFTTGPYRLSVTLETSAGTVSRFGSLMRDLDVLTQNLRSQAPDPSVLLDLEQTDALASAATTLRRRIGALSRYRRPEMASFEIDATSCVVRSDSGVWYLLYSVEHDRNVLVYFGEAPFVGVPNGWLAVDGERQPDVLATLLQYGFVAPAPAALLDRRLRAIEALAQNVVEPPRSPAEQRVLEVLSELDRLREGLSTDSQRRQYLQREARDSCWKWRSWPPATIQSCSCCCRGWPGTLRSAATMTPRNSSEACSNPTRKRSDVC
jgi:hypothetical protein